MGTELLELDRPLEMGTLLELAKFVARPLLGSTVLLEDGAFVSRTGIVGSTLAAFKVFDLSARTIPCELTRVTREARNELEEGTSVAGFATWSILRIEASNPAGGGEG